MFRIKKIVIIFILLMLLFITQNSFAINEEINDGYIETTKAKVIRILSEDYVEVTENGAKQLVQNIEVKILDGKRKDKIVKFENDRIDFKKGDKFYFEYYKYEDGSEHYSVIHRDRMLSILVLISIFILTIIAFGGWQGVRSLVSLFSGMFIILYVLVPNLLSGTNPIFVSYVVAAIILFLTIYLTHGFNRESTVAYVGTMISILFTGIFSIFSVYITKLSGFESEESIFLNFETGGSLDFVGLLLGSIVIGVIGVLDDIAVTQAAFVTELYNANKNISPKEVYKRASRVGKEHVGALVNTLSLAYTGAFLPIILYFKISPISESPILNLEIFSTELIRIIVSSVSLILTVPIVTLIAVKYLKEYKSKEGKKIHKH